jgi:tol-pal system protein YbgF
MKILRTLVVTAAALAAAGCVSSSDFESAQRQISELQEELANIKRTASSKEEVQNVNVRIAEQTEMLLKSNATLVTKVNDMDERIQSTQGAVEQAVYRLDQMSTQLSQTRRDMEDIRSTVATVQATAVAAPVTAAPATTTATGAPATGEMTVPAPAVPAADPMQTYQAAYRDYQRGNFDLAIEGFREFLGAAPTSDLADNAAYWVGESLFSQKKYREAIEQFDAVVNKYPKSDKVPGALLKKGYSYISINERAQGVVQLQYVVHEHPKSQEASLARQRLRQLGIETR